MKKIIVSLVALATITISAQAQTSRNNTGRTPDSTQTRHHFKGDHKQMSEKLQLTDDQKQQMKAIGTDMKSRMQDLKKSNLSTQDYNTKKEELFKERKQKMAALLTPEQKETMKQFAKEKHRKGKMDSAKRMQKMKEKLALSDDQVTRLNAQKEAFTSKAQAIKNNPALSADDKKTQMKAIREERKNSFRSILTPDQAKKIEEMKQKRAGKAA